MGRHHNSVNRLDEPLSVPVDLKYVELRLPGTFRELCADLKFSDEQIGRIVRCIALGTDSLITPDIEPEVFYYRQNQKKRLYDKLRKEKSRRKQCGNEGNYPDVHWVLDHHTLGAVQSQKIAESKITKTFPVASTTHAIAPNPVEPIKPITPQVLDHLPVQNPLGDQKPRTKAEKARDALADDLFACVGGSEGTKAERKRAMQVSQSASAVDIRNDAAWIPAKFAIFWAQYPRKVAKSDAVKAFTKLIKSQADVDKFMTITLASLAYWKTQDQWTKDNGKFIPYPASWLNAGHWNDCENGDVNKPIKPVQATFLRGDAESDEDLIKRMTSG